VSRVVQLCPNGRVLTSVRTCLRVWYQRACIRPVVLLGALIGCGSSENAPTAVTPPTVPPLESVPFQLLGSGKVAFERIGGSGAYTSIYTVDGTAMRSTHAFDGGPAFGPALSPDGGRIAFLRYTDSATWFDVYVANIDGTAVQHVTRFPLHEGPPTWTPDGAGVVMTVSAADGILQDVYVQSPVLNSADRKRLTNFKVGAGGSVECPIILDNTVPVSISGQGMVAFACQFGEIDVLSSNGTLSASYVPLRNDRRRWPNVFVPSWSPDGTRLAFIETTSDSATNEPHRI
jgi:hypothetical protein